MRTFRTTTKGESRGAQRTVGELRALAETQRAEREKEESAREKKAEAAAEALRQRRLTKLADDVDAAWAKLEKLVEAKSYDEAVTLAVDLRDLATRDGTAAGFAKSFEMIRKRLLRRRRFFDRWKLAERRP